MKNVSFDNPYLLLLFIPVAIAVIIPSIIAMVKGIKTRSVVVSMVIHITIAAIAILALAGMKTETVITKTEIYVVADVSYSSEKSLDKIDEYIKQTMENAPKNSQVGVVCFGKDAKTFVEMGGEIKSVKLAEVDKSATDISSALNFTADKFSPDTIKRVVLITDGRETTQNAEGRLISAIENLYAKNIYVDAVYIDSNLSDNDKEIQISDAQTTPSTYINHESSVSVAIQSSYNTKAIIHLYKNGDLLESKAVNLIAGYNFTEIDLDTAESGEFNYKVELSTEEIEDMSPHNNSYSFTQRVSGELKVLLVTSKQDDVKRANELYGENASIEVVGSVNVQPLPCDVEALCQYDEIIISDIDLSTLENYDAFINGVEKAVALFGKTLITLGDLKLQNTTNETLKRLENLLPVNFGNDSENSKLYTIVVDISRSMNQASKLIMAKQATIQLMGLLSDNDYVCIVEFAGDARVAQAPTKAINREKIATDVVERFEATQGTCIGAALDETFKAIADLPYKEKQVMLISDGLSSTLEVDNPNDVARKMKQANIFTSVLYISTDSSGESTLMNVASYGGGKYYAAKSEKELNSVMFDKIADRITVSVVEESSPVRVNVMRDEILKDIIALPNINGYVFATIKASATTVLVSEHEKSDGEISTPPIYAYWNHGNGRVCTFTSSFTGNWVKSWDDTDGEKLLSRIVSVNTPDERVDFPYNFNAKYDGINTTIELIPASVNPYATVHMEIKLPNGEIVKVSSLDDVTFDSEKYEYILPTLDTGKYDISVKYSYGSKEFVSENSFNVSYSPEYDSFVSFSPSSLLSAVRNRGTVSTDGVPKLENDSNRVKTYVVSYVIPFLIIAVCLFVADVIVRKLKWNDIKGLFKKTKVTGGEAK